VQASGSSIDVRQPSLARVYDYWLGGTQHYRADRQLAAAVEAAYGPPAPGQIPVPRLMAAQNKMFVSRAVSWAVHQGIRQVIDLSPGLPAAYPHAAGKGMLQPVHEVAQAAAPAARVAVVSPDPSVFLPSRALLRSHPGTRAVKADPARPGEVLGDPELGVVIDLARPVCLVMAMTAQQWDAGQAEEITGEYAAAAAPGSYLILSCPRTDDMRLWERLRLAAPGMHNHCPHAMERFFGETELVPPGVAPARGWQGGWSDAPGPDAAAYVLAGMARKP
jgi:hypothetical protein